MALSTVKSRTFLDEITLGDDEFDGWVNSALSGSQDFVQELLELGEDSLEFSAAEDELRKLQVRLNDAESRESRLKQELNGKCEKLAEMEDLVNQLKKEIMEERCRAKDEAEDMAQEMAELRYQMGEMLEEERQLRAHTEKVSVHRVEELESQVKEARGEVLAALTRRREAESQAEKEILELRLAIQSAHLRLEEARNVFSRELENTRQERCILLEELSRLKDQLARMVQKEVEVPVDDSFEGDSVKEIITLEELSGHHALQEEKPHEIETEDQDHIISGSGEVPVASENIESKGTGCAEERAEDKCSKGELADESGETFNEDSEKNPAAISSHDFVQEEVSSEAVDVVDNKCCEQELAQGKLAECQHEIQKQSGLVAELSGRIKCFEIELESERASHSETMCALKDTSQKLSTLETELAQCKTNYEMLQQATEGEIAGQEREKAAQQENLEQLKGLLQAREQSLDLQQQEIHAQRAANSQLTRNIGQLNSEVLILQKQLISCQTQVAEMAMKNVILEDTILAKKKKIKEGEDRISEQSEKLARQEERYFNLQAKLNALQNDFSLLEAKLGETRRREQESRAQVERLCLELTVAKQEVVNSEIRLQKSLKQVEPGKSRADVAVSKQKQTEQYVHRILEQLKRTEDERDELVQNLQTAP